jgi:hypothetical protein
MVQGTTNASTANVIGKILAEILTSEYTMLDQGMEDVWSHSIFSTPIP